MRVALAQINTTVGDVWGNAEKAASALARATEAGAGLVALPELSITATGQRSAFVLKRGR